MNRKIHFILNYIISKKKSFLMVLVCCAIFAFTFWMYGITVAAVLYPALVCMVIMAAAFAIMAYQNMENGKICRKSFKGQSEMTVSS